jgi:hypothetical protein
LSRCACHAVWPEAAAARGAPAAPQLRDFRVDEAAPARSAARDPPEGTGSLPPAHVPQVAGSGVTVREGRPAWRRRGGVFLGAASLPRLMRGQGETRLLPLPSWAAFRGVGRTRRVCGARGLQRWDVREEGLFLSTVGEGEGVGRAGGSLGPREVSARNCPSPLPQTSHHSGSAWERTARAGLTGPRFQSALGRFQMRTLISGGGTTGVRSANGDRAGVELTMYAWNWREEECKHGSGRGWGMCSATAAAEGHGLKLHRKSSFAPGPTAQRRPGLCGALLEYS